MSRREAVILWPAEQPKPVMHAEVWVEDGELYLQMLSNGKPQSTFRLPKDADIDFSTTLRRQATGD